MACCRQKPVHFAIKAKNASGAVFRVTKNVLSGRRVLVPDDVKDKRIAICKNCPDDAYDEARDQCSICGCYITKSPIGVGKAMVASEFCPKFHWNHYEA